MSLAAARTGLDLFQTFYQIACIVSAEFDQRLKINSIKFNSAGSSAFSF